METPLHLACAYLLHCPSHTSPAAALSAHLRLPSPSALSPLLSAHPSRLCLLPDRRSIRLALAPEEQLLVTFLLSAPRHTSLISDISRCCPLPSCARRPGAYGRFLRARPFLFAQEGSGNAARLLSAAAPHTPEEALVVAFLSSLPLQRCNPGLVASRCPLPSCEGRPGAYLRWFRARPHLFLLEEYVMGGSSVALLGSPQLCPPPTPAAEDRARRGLGGVAGCALCGLPFFTSAEQRGHHEGGGRHTRLLSASRSALSRMGINSAGERLDSAPPQHGIAAALEAGEELAAPPGGSASCTLRLTNHSEQLWFLNDAAVLQPKCGELRVVGAAAAQSSLQPGAVAAFQVRFAPTQPATTRVLVTFSIFNEAGETSNVGCALLLRCSDPLAAAELAALAPKQPYQPRQRSRRAAWGREVEEAPQLAAAAPPLAATRPWLPPKVSLDKFNAKDSLQLAHGSGRRAHLLRVLLMLEELAAREDMAAFDMHGVAIEAGGLPNSRDPGVARLAVAGLAESRPSVTRGDTVLLNMVGGRGGAPFRARVCAVGQAMVGLALGPMGHAAVRNPAARFDVRFEQPRATYLVQHAAVAGVGDAPPLVDAVTDPRGAAPTDAELAAPLAAPPLLPSPLSFSQLNEAQRRAVAGALQAPMGAPLPAFIIFGPPGTGKTTTLAEYVLQVVARAKGSGARPGAPASVGSSGSSEGSGGAGGSGFFSALSSLGRSLLGRLAPILPPHTLILLAAPSNSAVDVLCERLLKWLPPGTLLRVNAFLREGGSMSPELRAASAPLSTSEGYLLPTRAQLGGAWVVAATCITAQRMLRTLQKSGQPPLFSHVCVDEAGQATEPETLCAIAGALRPAAAGSPHSGRVVLAGDPKQLGPILRSPIALAHGLGVSLLERLMAGGPHSPAPSGRFNPSHVVLLTQNYRSHPALIALPSALFYGDALRPAVEPGEASAFARWPGLAAGALATPQGFPLLFHGLRGRDLREGNSPSYFNPEEALAAVQHVESVLSFAGGGLRPDEVGIIAPYAKQCQKIRELLAKRKALAGVAVGSVELFQGGERRVVVVSTVRTTRELIAFDAKHALGFLDNPKRFNVAITRAKQLLIVVGDPHVLCLDNSWSALLRYAVANGAYKGCELPGGYEGGAEGAGGGLLQRLQEEVVAEALGGGEGGAAACAVVRGEEMGMPHIDAE